ncbi:MAG: hypothetical protein LBE91_08995 [Tannerella sp.]|nr:hypothetical protein [Tannerella sp.]
MKAKIFLVLTVLTLAGLVSCNSNINPDIQEDTSLVFIYKESGGWTGLNEELKIAKDNMHYSISYRDLQTQQLVLYSGTVETSAEVWQKLLQTFDFDSFRKIKDGSCQSCVDGTDKRFIVQIDGQEYAIYNGYEDENYKKMQAFFDLMLEQAEKFSDNY